MMLVFANNVTGCPDAVEPNFCAFARGAVRIFAPRDPATIGNPERTVDDAFGALAFVLVTRAGRAGLFVVDRVVVDLFDVDRVVLGLGGLVVEVRAGRFVAFTVEDFVEVVVLLEDDPVLPAPQLTPAVAELGLKPHSKIDNLISATDGAFVPFGNFAASFRHASTALFKAAGALKLRGWTSFFSCKQTM